MIDSDCRNEIPKSTLVLSTRVIQPPQKEGWQLWGDGSNLITDGKSFCRCPCCQHELHSQTIKFYSRVEFECPTCKVLIKYDFENKKYYWKKQEVEEQ